MHLERYGAVLLPAHRQPRLPRGLHLLLRQAHDARLPHVPHRPRARAGPPPRPTFVRACYFVDDNLAGDPDYSRELFRALAKTGVRFGMQARHEFARDMATI